MSKEITEMTINGQTYVLFDSPEMKCVRSADYNYDFRKTDGFFQRWGKTFDDNPSFAPSAEILDIEVSVNGCPNGCRFCYKGNTPQPATNMTFDTFKTIIDKFPKILTQVAFGITGIQTNPDFLRMMHYCREIGIIPNFTLSGIDLTDELADECAKVIGAVAVSAYQTDKNVCYNTVKKFLDRGIKQTNIHLLVAQENLPFVYEVLQDRLTDSRLQGMNAIVFLGVKPKGRAVSGYTPLSLKQYQDLVRYCFDKEIPIGFDSCSAPKFEAAVKDESFDMPQEQKNRLIQCSESCESSAFSSYINVHGLFFPCSFSENECGFDGVSVLDCNSFLDVWYSADAKRFREALKARTVCDCRHCPIFPVLDAEIFPNQEGILRNIPECVSGEKLIHLGSNK